MWKIVLAGVLALSASAVSARTPQVGDVAPDFTVRTFDGKPHTLAEFRGKVLVINYWATWCGPCKVELPMLEAYYRRRAADGLEVIAVTTEDSLPKGSLRKLDEALAIPLANHMNSKGAYAPIRGAVPTNFVIGRDGRVRYAQPGAFTVEGLVATLDPLLEEPAP